MRRLLARLGAPALLLVASAGAVPAETKAIPASVDPSEIPNYRLVSPGLATAGQPGPETLKRLKEMGFRTVVNLRPESEGTQPEEDLVRSLGLTYVSVPVTPATFSLEDALAVGKVLDDPAAAPVLFHCASANRVGGVWAVLQVRKGKPYEEAEREAREIGLKSPEMIAAVERVLRIETR